MSMFRISIFDEYDDTEVEGAMIGVRTLFCGYIEEIGTGGGGMGRLRADPLFPSAERRPADCNEANNEAAGLAEGGGGKDTGGGTAPLSKAERFGID